MTMYARLPDHQVAFANTLARDLKKLTRLPGVDHGLAVQVLGICNDANPLEVERLLDAPCPVPAGPTRVVRMTSRTPRT